MQRFAAIARAFDRARQRFVLKKLAGFDLVIDQRHVYANHTTRTDVQMAHFRISHYARGQTDAQTVRFEQRLRVFLTKLVVKRRGCERDGVALASR